MPETIEPWVIKTTWVVFALFMANAYLLAVALRHERSADDRTPFRHHR
jgi:hypothetical protein